MLISASTNIGIKGEISGNYLFVTVFYPPKPIANKIKLIIYNGAC